MQYAQLFCASMLSIGISSQVYANTQDTNKSNKVDLSAQSEIAKEKLEASSNTIKISSEPLTQQIIDSEAELKKQPTTPVIQNPTLKDLRQLKIQDFKVNATAAQPEYQKDPLQPLNRKIHGFNNTLDTIIVRPIAVQYVTKVPEDVRDSTRMFRSNLGEPWNAVNQIFQGRFKRAAKTLGRFTINTVTSLGFADVARHLALPTEDEKFGTTLGYYGVPSGPYIVIPFLGPSTFRDGFGRIVDSQARPQKYILDDRKGIYYSDWALGGIDARAQLLQVEDVLQGDKYSAIRDIYLQRNNFIISEKKGLENESNLFIDDEIVDENDESTDQDNVSVEQDESGSE